MTLTERIEELATVMRRVGAVRAEVNKTGIKLELGSPPHTAPARETQKTDTEVMAEAKAAQAQYERTLFAASEGVVDAFGDE